MSIDAIFFLGVVIIISIWVSMSDPENRKLKPLNIEGPPRHRSEDDKIYHPVTGYSAYDQETMNAYIQNREKRIRDGEA